MTSTDLHDWFRELCRQERPAERTFLSPAELRTVLWRERLRSDRSGNPFSMLVFTIARGDERNGVARRLRTIFEQRLRISDEVGRLDARRFAVVLPDTRERGARTVAAEVAARCGEFRDAVEMDVFVYPSPTSRGDDDDDRRSDERPAPNIGLPLHGNAAAPPVQSLETMFMRRLPVWKRAIDVVGAATGLIVTAPLILGSAVLIKLTSPGPAFFAQRRSGLGGVPFRVYKLRTMYVDAEARQDELRPISEQDGPAFKLRNDPRITRVGKYLRMTCLDELPQLWNVLKGEMTLVGPRPLPCVEQAGCQPWQQRRLDVTPGVTCIWQVEGGAHVPFAEWMRMDLRYIRGRRLRNDVRLIFKTLGRVVARRGS